MPEVSTLLPGHGNWAGSPSMMTYLPPQRPCLWFVANFLHSPSAVWKRKKSNKLNSSMTRTSIFFTWVTCTVPFSRLELQSMSSEKKSYIWLYLEPTNPLDFANSISPVNKTSQYLHAQQWLQILAYFHLTHS